MPRSMLISRKRLPAAAGDQQPAAPMDSAPPPTPVANQLEEVFRSSFTATDDEVDDDDELDMDCGSNSQCLAQPMAQQQPQGQLDHQNGGDQQVDTLTNAIIYFVSLFNQQQQQLQQQQQQQQPTPELPNPIERPPSVVERRELPPVRPIKREIQSSRRSAAGSQKSQLISQLRQPKQRQQQQQQQQQPNIMTVAPKLELNSQQIFLNSDDLIDTQLSNQSQGKRSSSGSGSGSDDNFVHYCVDCGKRYSTSSNLARHRQTHRDVTDKKAKKCPECDKIYVSMPAFSMHLRTHNQGCICSECGKSFSRPWLLQGHMRTHTGEKPFKCKICEKAFADKSNLRAHIQTHSTTKPFVCDRCNKAFALKSYLCKHVDSTCMRASNGSQKEPLNLKVLNHPKHETRSRSGQC